MAGVAFPDVAVFGSDALLEGWLGARVASYFGLDWSVESARPPGDQTSCIPPDPGGVARCDPCACKHAAQAPAP